RVANLDPATAEQDERRNRLTRFGNDLTRLVRAHVQALEDGGAQGVVQALPQWPKRRSADGEITVGDELQFVLDPRTLGDGFLQRLGIPHGYAGAVDLCSDPQVNRLLQVAVGEHDVAGMSDGAGFVAERGQDVHGTARDDSRAEEAHFLALVQHLDPRLARETQLNFFGQVFEASRLL